MKIECTKIFHPFSHRPFLIFWMWTSVNITNIWRQSSLFACWELAIICELQVDADGCLSVLVCECVICSANQFHIWHLTYFRLICTKNQKNNKTTTHYKTNVVSLHISKQNLLRLPILHWQSEKGISNNATSCSNYDEYFIICTCTNIWYHIESVSAKAKSQNSEPYFLTICLIC